MILSLLKCSTAFLLTILLFSSCSSTGPNAVTRDRFAYINAISESWKSQLLLNIVKMRYGDAPVFMDVSSVISQYEISGKVEAGAAFQSNGIGWGPEASGGAAFTDRPTITYSPITGSKFAMNLMRPLHPGLILGLIYSGYPVHGVMRLTVNSIAGHKNTFGGYVRRHEASPVYFDILRQLKVLQEENCMNLTVKWQGSNKERFVIEAEKKYDSAAEVAMKNLNMILGLPESNRRYVVDLGITPSDSVTLPIDTRSMIEILCDISSRIIVPQEHVDQGITYASPEFTYPVKEETRTYLKIQSSREQPKKVFSAVPYHGYWYFIDDSDFESKQTFSHLLFLSTIGEVSDTKSAPVITIPTR